jgi:glycosyltransferase involved in cell wall biosynthesis
VAARGRRRSARAGRRDRRRPRPAAGDLALAALSDSVRSPSAAPGPPKLRELVHVSASLRRDGGGAAHFGRLAGRALRRFAAERRLRFRGLHLPPGDGEPALDGYQSCGGAKLLALAAIVARGARGARAALFFDHPGPARAAALLPSGRGAPYAVALLGVDAWQRFDWAGRRALAGARAVVAISEETARRAAPFLPRGCRVRVVQPGIEPPLESGEVDRGLLARAGERFVLVVGRMVGRERYKGHDELLAALARLARSGSPARLVVAGDGGDRARLERLAAELGVAGRTLFAGAVSPATLTALYRRAALFAMPSRLEGFGLVFVEAMAAGAPCVALAGTAPAEIVVDGETGLLVPPDDVAALARALDALLADPERARALGAAGRARYEREYTAEAFERRFEPVADELLGPG